MPYAFGSVNGGAWSSVAVAESAEPGYVNLAYPSGLVVSVQPDGSLQTRPAGTDGPYERGIVTGDLIVFGPYPGTAETGPISYPFALFEV